MSVRGKLAALTATILLIGGVVAGCSSTTEESGVTVDSVQNGSSLSVADFASLLEQEGVVLLDVRTPEEYAAGHLKGSVNIDMEAADFADNIAQLDTTVTYAIYCRTDNRTGVTKVIMEDAGFDHVVDLDGGINAWAEAGNPIVTN